MAFCYPIVSTDWLADHLFESDLMVIDGSWRMPGAAASARKDYKLRHVPGAVFFDLDEIADYNTNLPHMLPEPEAFARAVGEMGINNESRIVVYDDAGLFSSARVWWTFRALGHEKVSVLDGGLPKWTAERRPVTAETANLHKAAYHPQPAARNVCSATDVRRALRQKSAIVIDARPHGRFDGLDREPRVGLRSGAMPGAVNIPAIEMLTEAKTLKPAIELSALFSRHGVTPETGIITTCGSGVTASMLSLALEHIGHRRHALYDGSWAEWGHEDNDPEEFPILSGEGRRRGTKS